MTREEARKYMVERDEKFVAHKRAHRCCTYAIFILTATLGFKFNKLYYSFFYDLKQF